MIDLNLEIANRLAAFTDEVQEQLEKAADEVTSEALNMLKRTSPKKKKKYAKSWIRKKTPQGYVLHNRRYYLTHLLEHGHAKRGGGRVAAIKHIAPVEEETIKSFEQKIRGTLR